MRSVESHSTSGKEKEGKDGVGDLEQSLHLSLYTPVDVFFVFGVVCGFICLFRVLFVVLAMLYSS